VQLRQYRARWAFALAALVAIALIARHVLLAWLRWPDTPAAFAGIAVAAFMTGQWAVSLLYRPVVLTPDAQSRVDRLNVTVVIPCYNEDPAVLDRCLYALITQSRPPQRVCVVDDGSKIDYQILRQHWEGHWPRGTEVTWTRQVNQGKKRAQAVGFTSSPDADVFVTIDSDTALERRAIEEGVKPFADRKVSSVAGIEVAFNAQVNWLTQAMNSRGVFYQLVLCQVQGMIGDMYVNRGAFSLYRASLIRRIVPAYVGETFLGYPVRLGDDSALTLFARGSGRTVQQSTAFGLSMFPETFSHHARQRVRWGRGAAIRNLWRIRYLPVFSYVWWFTFIRIHVSMLPLAVPLLVVFSSPEPTRAVEQGFLIAVVWTLLSGLRTMSVHRSDENLAHRLMTALVRPTANVWALLVIIPIRFYGTVTFFRQGWTTRRKGAEPMAAVEEAAKPSVRQVAAA
jgi:hyaluronan synthase